MDGSPWRAIALLFRPRRPLRPRRDGPELSPLYPLISGPRSQSAFLQRLTQRSRDLCVSLDTLCRFPGDNGDKHPTIGQHGQSE